VLAVLALGTAGCEKQRLRWTAERVVRAYDEALAEAYRMSDATRLRDVAGAEETRRVQVLIDLKRASALVLESRLEALEVTSVRPEGADAITVGVRERWRYHDRPTRPGASAGPVFVAEMQMEWSLAREQGRWRVERGRTLSSRYLEPKGFTPAEAASRPASRAVAAGEVPR
jgi:hypothetical protein